MVENWSKWSKSPAIPPKFRQNPWIYFSTITMQKTRKVLSNPSSFTSCLHLNIASKSMISRKIIDFGTPWWQNRVKFWENEKKRWRIRRKNARTSKDYWVKTQDRVINTTWNPLCKKLYLLAMASLNSTIELFIDSYCKRPIAKWEILRLKCLHWNKENFHL